MDSRGVRLTLKLDSTNLATQRSLIPLFTALGFPVPDEVPLMKCEYQIAQKLHGLTEPDSRRVHDLIDLQLIVDHSQVDFAKVSQICRRLFSFRRMQPLPPRVVKGIDWETSYNDANFKHGVTRTIDDAINWANSLLEKIDKT